MYHCIGISLQIYIDNAQVTMLLIHALSVYAILYKFCQKMSNSVIKYAI